MDTICDYLAYDHKCCDELYTQVERSVTLKQWQQAEECFRLFDSALGRHLLMEETVLFPVFEETVRDAAAPLAMLRIEHQRIRVMIERIHDALCRSDPVDFVIHTETFSILMQEHSMKEENMLYPLLERILADRTAAIVGAMRAAAENTMHAR